MNNTPAAPGRPALRSRHEHWLLSLVMLVPFWANSAQGQSCPQVKDFFDQKVENLINIWHQEAGAAESLSADKGHVIAHCASLRKLDADARAEESMVGDLINTLRIMCGSAGADLASSETSIKAHQDDTARFLEVCPPENPVWKPVVPNQYWMDDSTIEKRGSSGGDRIVWFKTTGDPSTDNGTTEAWIRYVLDCDSRRSALAGYLTFNGEKVADFRLISEPDRRWENFDPRSPMADSLNYACSH